MGTVFRVVVHAPDRARAEAAADAAFAVVARLDSLFSDYRPDSEVARVARTAGEGGAVPASAELLAVLERAATWSARTGGAFDVTAGPLTRLWRWSSRRGELPDPGRLARARAAVGHRHLVVDAAAGTVRLERPGMALDLGGIGKGFAADAALRELARRGLASALVDAGGDVAVGDPPPGRAGWRIAVPGGGALVLSGAGVATSGDRHRHIEVDGVRYSHVVDPRTGLGVPDAPTVTVVAPDATTADVLASALGVLGPEEGRRLVRRSEGVEARVAGSGGWTSGGFPEPDFDEPPATERRSANEERGP